MPAARRLVAALALGCAAARVVSAQAGADSSATGCMIPPTSDSIDVFVTGRLESFDRKRPLPVVYSELLLEAIRLHLTVPQPLPVPVYTDDDTLQRRTNRGYPVLHAMLGVWPNSHDRGATVLVKATSLVPAFDSALREAVVAAVADSGLPAAAEVSRGKDLEIRLLIATSARADSGAFPLFRMRVPHVEFSWKVMPLHKAPYGPHYPDNLRAGWVAGRVRIAFVVDEAGVPLLSSAVVTEATHTDFAASVLEYLGRARFQPGVIAGCTVRVLVAQPFDFTLTR